MLVPQVVYFAANCSLQQLYLGGNRLRDIPPTIGQLSKLTSLTLCDNRLENIPSSIAQLQLLESLMLHNNRLTVGHLKRLQRQLSRSDATASNHQTAQLAPTQSALESARFVAGVMANVTMFSSHSCAIRTRSHSATTDAC